MLKKAPRGAFFLACTGANCYSFFRFLSIGEKKGSFMKKLLWHCVIVLVFGFGFSAPYCCVQQEVIPCECGLSDSYDEFDLWVDKAVEGGVLKKNIEFEQPTRTKRIVMWCAAPLVRLYTSTVLKYRAVKSWVTRYASQSGSSILRSCFCSESCDTSEAKSEK